MRPRTDEFFTGVSSNGRTRDFGSLYHGSNPCAPTNIQTRLARVLILVLGRRMNQPFDNESVSTQYERSFCNAKTRTNAPQPPQSGERGNPCALSHLYSKTLSMFCKHFGKSQISQNASGEHPHSPVCAPTNIQTRLVRVFILVLERRKNHPRQSREVRQAVGEINILQ